VYPRLARVINMASKLISPDPGSNLRTPRLNRLVTEERWAAIGEGIPLGRAALPDEVAGPLLFLASDLSTHISGAVLAIDGAMGAMAAIPPAFIKTLKAQ
jgi:NAD(P)-dependent dehydrogenase (short-subunit alcohol dehydrogenase family)